MGRKMRVAKAQMGQLSDEELEARSKWGGLLGGVPELDAEQRQQWRAARRARSDWVPQRALRYLWLHADPLHGCGGEIFLGRPRRPEDDDACRWALGVFLTCLARDRCEMRRVWSEHPEQRHRLRQWSVRLEALGRARDVDTEAREHTAFYYGELSKLGYDATANHGDDDAPAA